MDQRAHHAHFRNQAFLIGHADVHAVSRLANLKITIATDMRSCHTEREIARQQNVQRRRGYEYDLVTVEGTLKVKNYKPKDVRLNIRKTLRGAVESQSDDDETVKLGEAVATDSPLSRHTWEIALKAGEERIVTYRYRV